MRPVAFYILERANQSQDWDAKPRAGRVRSIGSLVAEGVLLGLTRKR